MQGSWIQLSMEIEYINHYLNFFQRFESQDSPYGDVTNLDKQIVLRMTIISLVTKIAALFDKSKNTASIPKLVVALEKLTTKGASAVAVELSEFMSKHSEEILFIINNRNKNIAHIPKGEGVQQSIESAKVLSHYLEVEIQGTDEFVNQIFTEHHLQSLGLIKNLHQLRPLVLKGASVLIDQE